MARVAVSGGVRRRAGVGLVMSPRGPKVLYGKRFRIKKWCERLTPRNSNRIFLLHQCTPRVEWHLFAIQLSLSTDPLRPESLAKVGWVLGSKLVTVEKCVCVCILPFYITSRYRTGTSRKTVALRWRGGELRGSRYGDGERSQAEEVETSTRRRGGTRRGHEDYVWIHRRDRCRR